MGTYSIESLSGAVTGAYDADTEADALAAMAADAGHYGDLDPDQWRITDISGLAHDAYHAGIDLDGCMTAAAILARLESSDEGRDLLDSIVHGGDRHSPTNREFLEALVGA